MPSIDNRVVNMRFENRDFQSGVSDSIDSIDKLKRALDFTGAEKGFRDVEQSINSASFDQINDNVDKIADHFTTLGVVATSVLANIGTEVYRLGKRLITAIPKQIMTGGWNRAANIEQAKFQLKGLGVAWEDINNQIDFAVSGTAYGLDEAAKVASQLVASNVDFWEGFKAEEAYNAGEALDLMSHSLRGISGVAAMTNTSYSEIGQIFTTIAGSGRAVNQELDRFAFRGLNVRATLADFINDVNSGTLDVEDYVWDAVQSVTTAMDVTEADIRDFASKNKISFDLFASAMDYAFGEHAKDANETFDGALANMKASLSRIGADFATPIREGATDIFNAFRLLFNAFRTGTKIDPKTGEIIYDFGNAFGTMALTNPDSGFDFLYSFGDAVQFIVDKIMSVDLSWVESAVVVFDDLFTTLVNFGLGIGGIATRISDAWHMIIPQGLGDIITGITGKIRDASFWFRDLFGIVYEDEGESGEMPLVDEAEQIADAAETVVMAAETIDEYAGYVIQGLFGVGEERRAALEELGLSFEAIQNRVNELLGCSFRYNVTAEEQAQTTEDLQKQLEELGVSWDALPESMRQAMLNGEDVSEDMQKQLADLGISYDMLPESMKQAMQGSNEFTETLEQNDGQLQTTSGFLEMIQGLTMGIAGAVMIVKDIFVGAWEGLIKPGLEKLMELLDPVFEYVGGLGTSLSEIATKWHEEGTILQWFKDVASWIGGAAQKVEEFIDKLKQMPYVAILLEKWGEFVDWISGIKDSGLSVLETLFGETLPSWIPTMDDLLNVVNTIAGAFLWVADLIVNKIWPAVSGFFSGLNLKGIGGFFKNIWDFIVGFFSGFDYSGITNFVNSVISTFVTLFKSITENKELGEVIVNALTSIWDAVIAFFASIDVSKTGAALGNIFGSIWGGFVNFLRNIDLSEVFDVVSTIIRLVIDFSILTMSYSIGRAVANINQMLNAVSHALYGAQVMMFATALLEVAAAVLVMVTALLMLSLIPEKKLAKVTETLNNVVLDLTLLILTVGLVLKLLTDSRAMNFFRSGSNNQFFQFRLLPNVAANWIAFGVALTAIVYSFKSLFELFLEMKGHVPTALAAGFTLLSIMALIPIIAMTANKFGSVDKTKMTDGVMSWAAAMISFGAAVYLLVSAFEKMSKLSWSADVGWMMAFFLSIPLIFAAFANVITDYKAIMSIGGMFILLALGINMLVPPLMLLSSILVDSDKLWQAVGAISALLGAFMVFFVVMGAMFSGQPANTSFLAVIGEDISAESSTFKQFAPLLLNMAAAVVAFAVALSMLKDQSFGQLMGSVGAIAALVAIFGVFGYLINKIPGLYQGLKLLVVVLTYLGGSLLLISAAAELFADALKILSDRSINAKQAGKNLAEGIVAFFDVLVESGDSIIKFISGLIEAIIVVILAKKALITGAAGSIFTSITKWLTINGKARIIAVIAVLLVALIAFLNDATGPVVSALVAIVVKIIDAISLAIMDNGLSLGYAIGNLIKAIILGVIEAIVGLFSGLFGIHINFEKWDLINRENVIKDIEANSERTTKVIDAAGEALKERGRSFLSKSDEAADDIRSGKQEVADAYAEPVAPRKRPDTDSGSGGMFGTDYSNLTEEEEEALSDIQKREKAYQEYVDAAKEAEAERVARQKELDRIRKQQEFDSAGAGGSKRQQLEATGILPNGNLVGDSTTKDAYGSGIDFGELLGSGTIDGYSSIMNGTDVAEQLGGFFTGTIDSFGNVATEAGTTFKGNFFDSSTPSVDEISGWASNYGLELTEKTEESVTGLETARQEVEALGVSYEALPQSMRDAIEAEERERMAREKAAERTAELSAAFDEWSQSAEGFYQQTYGIPESMSAGLGIDWRAFFNLDEPIPKDYWPTEFAKMYRQAEEANDPTTWIALGAFVQEGLQNGMLDNMNLPEDAAEKTGFELANTIAASLGIASPSKVTAEQGRYVDEGLALGIKENAGVVRNPIRYLINSMVSILRSAKDKFYQAGVYAVKGFAQGIQDNIFIAEEAARIMVRAAIIAAKEEEDANSPAKEFEKLGAFGGMGYANGLLGMSSTAEDAARSVVMNSLDTVRDTISMLAAAIESDIEIDPTIRPVLDLSQLRAGASQANSLLTRTLSTVPDYARAARAGTEVNGMKATAARVKADQTGNFNSHIHEIRADIHDLKDAMGQMQMVMDTGALVGSIQKPMDRAFGKAMTYSNRRL